MFSVVKGFLSILKDEKTSKYTKYSVGESRYFGVDENTGDIFVAGILFGQANTVIMSVIHDISFFMNKNNNNNNIDHYP